MSKIKMGDFIKISYNLKVKETAQLIETTDEAFAKKEGIYDEKQFYGPRLMIVGNDETYLKRLSNEILDKEVGAKLRVEIPPDETFGQRDPAKIKTLGRKELIAKNILPEIGKQIQWGNQNGIIRSSVGGRVRVDFNHPLVGQTIIYDLEIVEKITTFKKKIESLIDFRMPGIEINKFKITDEPGKLTIIIPEDILTKDPYIQFRKIRIANDVNKYFTDRKEVVFIDIFTFNENQ